MGSLPLGDSPSSAKRKGGDRRLTEGKGTNKEIKKKNRNRIFRYVSRTGRSSNPAIAYALQMSLPTVLQNTRELKKTGVLYDAGELESTGGRKANTVDVVADFRYAIGIDITLNHVVIVLTNLIGANLDRERFFMPYRDDEDYYNRLRELLESFVERNKADRKRILGVGISIPGIVNYDTQKIDYSHVLGLKQFPLKRISAHIPYRTWFVNDANAGAFAEGFQTADEDHFFYLSLNNTVGGGFYDRNRLLYGDHYRCGEVGHMTAYPGGRKCYCGKLGCADSYLSALRLAELEDGNLELFFEKLKQGSQKETERWKDYVGHLALVINNVHMILDFDMVIGGYVGSAMGDYIDDIRREVAQMDIFGQDASFVRACSYKISESAFGAALHEIEGFVKDI